MPRPAVYIIYNLLLPVALLLGLPTFVIKGIRRGGLARNFRQRLGLFREETLARFQGEKPIWIHAVSVGEIFVALKIVESLQNAAPGQKILLTTTTTTGYTVASEKESDTLTVIHNPVDLPFVTSRVIRLIDPSQLILVEAEVWPNLVGQLKRREIPVKLVNARLSPRSEKRYQKFLPLIQPVFSLLDGVSVPFEVDRNRWAGLGVPLEKIFDLGSVKFDNGRASETATEQITELRDWLAETGFSDESRILLGGSTHDGEELLLAKTAFSLRETFPDLALVIIPRHAERGGEIASQLGQAGFNPVLKSESNRAESNRVRSTTQPCSPDEKRIWIANTTGELRSWFHLAELVVIGKSFTAEGGQNPVEPILAGRPVIVGPNMQNFSDVVADLKLANGIRQVAATDELAEALENFLDDPQSGLEMAERGKAAMARHEGSADRTAAFILNSVAGQTGFDQPT